ncbi:polysaccharide pyruvyl transferase family protein [Serratia sp. AKBS12]|uniref:polysaccharide pyruvyl transferase family protein n=1 Tax=Serratia sp. AKBS12 TaxID=2974597 RepID=UPI0021666273|nr:polysaccharide pyruvyl transferase family protein [Serratia sp. AKBS12]MCS3409376.1 polysaccharide pyruvyl transferase family protein [Serratia sp. AKBS12]
MKTIITINEVCSDNIGDHAINEGLKKLITASGYSVESYGFDAEKKIAVPKVTNEKLTAKVFLRKAKNLFLNRIQFLKYARWYLHNKKRIESTSCRDAEIMMIGGGQLIQSGGTFPIAMYTWAKYAKKNNKKYVILGVGCAEKFSWLDSVLYKYALKHANGVYVREKRSIDKLKRFFDFTPSYIPDLAFSLYEKESYPEKGSVIIGATAYYVYSKNVKETGQSEFKTQQEYIEDWRQVVEDEIKKAGKKVVLASTTVEDAELNKLIYKEVLKNNSEENIELCEKVPALNIYLDYLRVSSKVYSGRMHSLILGKILGNDLEPWLISKKIEYFMDEYGNRHVEEINKELKDVFANIIKKFG